MRSLPYAVAALGLAALCSTLATSAATTLNYSDRRGEPHITEETRRLGQLCWLLRARTLVDVDCWTRVPGQPLRPGA
ncbi:MAG: hypothetical protein ACO3IN_12050, partial [Steroidobacteraceae bacterium]